MRSQYPDVFNDGEYLDLNTEGPRADHICSFARRNRGKEVVVAAGRWFVRLARNPDDRQAFAMPVGSPVWDETWVAGPDGAESRSYRNFLTNEPVQVVHHGDGIWFSAAELFRDFPVALLASD